MAVTPDRDAPEHDEALEQAYARWLDASMRVSFAASLLAFLLYATGLLPSFVPLDALPGLWGLPVDQYLEKTGAPSGWAWARLLGYSDYFNLACIALIGMVTLLCYLRVLPLLLRLRERLQASLVIVQVLVLLVAVSGLFSGGR